MAEGAGGMRPGKGQALAEVTGGPYQGLGLWSCCSVWLNWKESEQSCHQRGKVEVSEPAAPCSVLAFVIQRKPSGPD